MKVEEIKLAFEANVQFAISNDIEAILDKGFNFIDEYNNLQKQSELKSKLALDNADEAIKLCQKAISLAKDLGVPLESFNSQLSLAKNLNTRSSKAKANIL